MSTETNAYKASMEAPNIRSEQFQKEMNIPAQVMRILNTAEYALEVKQSLAWIRGIN